MYGQSSIFLLSLLLMFTGTQAALATSDKFNSGRLYRKTLQTTDGTTYSFVAENKNDILIAEGDMLLGPAPSKDSAIAARGSGVSIIANRWHDGLIPFQFSTRLNDPDLISRIYQAVAHWNDKSSVRLVERTSENAAIFADYLEFTEGGSCASYVGRLSGKQEIWASSNCSTGSLIHEIGHAIGLLHEHTRNDRDQHILINYENILGGKEHNFAIPSTNAADLGDYDYGSIMHYGTGSFSKNGAPTISPVADTSGIKVGQRNQLSEGDLQAVDLLYGTDLALTLDTPESIIAGETFEVSINVTNQGEIGANELLIIAKLDAANTLLSHDGDGWNCIQQADKVLCGLAILIDSAQSNLRLNIQAGFNPPGTVPISLSSRTWDWDPDNNGLIIDEAEKRDARDNFFTEPAFGSAQAALSSSEDPVRSADGSDAGGGSVTPLKLLLLGMLVFVRRTS